MDEEGAHEERLKLLQDVRVYPVGRVLRETFDADNHDTLSSDVAGLMINLSRVPFDPAGSVPDRGPPTRPPQPGTAQRAATAQRGADRPGVLRKLGALLRGR